MDYSSLRWLMLKTGIVSALAALVVALRVDFQWGSAYASAALFGLANWVLLAGALICIARGYGVIGVMCVIGKVILLAGYFLLVVMPTGFVFSAFLLGYSTFLIVVTLQALGALLLMAISPRADGCDTMDHLRTILIGSTRDA